MTWIGQYFLWVAPLWRHYWCQLPRCFSANTLLNDLMYSYKKMGVQLVLFKFSVRYHINIIELNIERCKHFQFLIKWHAMFLQQEHCRQTINEKSHGWIYKEHKIKAHSRSWDSNRIIPVIYSRRNKFGMNFKLSLGKPIGTRHAYSAIKPVQIHQCKISRKLFDEPWLVRVVIRSY